MSGCQRARSTLAPAEGELVGRKNCQSTRLVLNNEEIKIVHSVGKWKAHLTFEGGGKCD